MLQSLKNLIQSSLGATEPDSTTQDRAHAVQLAAAALLIEMERADFDAIEAERSVSLDVLRRHFELTPEEAAALLAAAEGRSRRAVSLHEFTRLLHESLSEDEKLAVVEMLWRVAYADGRVDKHEEHLVRKIAGLLYLRDGALARLRWKVRQESDRSD